MQPLPPQSWGRREASHLLLRACLGAAPAEVAQAVADGLPATVRRLVRGGHDDDLFPLPENLRDTTHYIELFAAVQRAKDNPAERERARRELVRAGSDGINALRAWWIQRLRFSPHPLREVMALFWHGHFATSVEKVKNPMALLAQNETFRALGLGSFTDLAKAIAKDPAMMRYLDITESSARAPNENFARELFELFMLGEGRYTEEDIREAARAFTGFRIDPMRQEPRYVSRRADTGEKTVFGHTGRFGPDEVVELAAARPECAAWISGKLWEFFAGSKPEPALAADLAEAFRRQGMQTGPFLVEVFSSRAFYAPEAVGAQVKSPVSWLVGTAKALEMPLSGSRQEQGMLRALGQDLLAPPNVRGWEGGRAWISATTLIARCNLAGEFFLPALNLARIFPPEARLDARAACDLALSRLLATEPPPATRAALIAELEASGLPASANALSDLLRHVMNLPEFQLT